MLIKSPQQYLIDELNRIAGLALTVADVSFGLPQPLDTVGTDGSNTQVRITMTQRAPARGAMNLRYHRVPFSTVFTDPDGVNPLRFPVGSLANSSHDVLAQMQRFCGLNLSVDDIERTEIDWDRSHVLIKAAPESLGWLGEVTALISPGDVVISDAFKTVDLQQSFLYPYFNTKLGQAQVYSYRLDFSDYGSYLKAVTAGNVDLSQIAVILKAVTGDDWSVSRNPADYNLKEATVVYNGLNTNSQYPGNTNYSRILVLSMSLFSLKLGGYLYLQYNA